MAYYAESLINEVMNSLSGGVHVSIASTPVTFVSRADVGSTPPTHPGNVGL